VDPGKLRQRVTLQYSTIARSVSGEEVQTWTDQATVWAAIETMSARWREYMSSQYPQEVSEDARVVRIRWRADVKPTWRVKFKNRYFDIKAVLNSGELNEELLLMCTENLTGQVY